MPLIYLLITCYVRNIKVKNTPLGSPLRFILYKVKYLLSSEKNITFSNGKLIKRKKNIIIKCIIIYVYYAVCCM